MPSSILVIGANRGIGLALVQALHAQNPESTIFATTRSPSDDLNAVSKESNGRVVVLEGVDTLDTAALKKAASEITEKTSTLDKIYINAGVQAPVLPIAQVTQSTLESDFQGNVVGPHNAFVAFSPFILESKAEKRTIIVTSSGLGSVSSVPDLVQWIKSMGSSESTLGSYSVSKAAVNMLSRQWAEVLEPEGVSVLVMHPGLVATRMAGKIPGAIPPEESATAILKLVSTFDPKDTVKGIHSYDGKLYGW